MKSVNILNTPIIISDVETSGKNPFFDQHLSSGKIRIHEGKVLDTFYEECRCENSRIPSARALFVNGLNTKTLSEGQPLKNLLKADYDFVNQYPDDFILAHNAKFDFNFTFCGFFQNLITDDWYIWKTKNKLLCSLEMIKNIWSFKRQLSYLNIPVYSLDTPDFRLENLSYENGISHDSHNSFGDCKATSELYKLMKNESPEIIRQAMMCSNKKFVLELIRDNSFFCSAIGFGQDLYPRILAPICLVSNKNELICLDIAQVDPAELQHLSSFEIYLQTSEQKLDNVFVRLPINKSKIFFGEYYYKKSFNPFNLTLDQLRNRANAIRKNLYFKEACEDSHRFFNEKFSDKNLEDHLEKKIFESFALPNEINFINTFNNIPWQDRWQFINENDYLDHNSRIVRLAKKSLLEFDFSLAPMHIQDSYKKHISKRLFNIGEDLPWNNIVSVIGELDELKEEFPAEIARIKEIEAYIDSRLSIL